MDKRVVLEAKGIAKRFGKGKASFWAVRPLDLRLEEGECLALVGESGSGKSTLGRMLASLLKPTRGELRILGENAEILHKKEKRRFYRHVQMVFQQPYTAVSPWMRIETFVAQGLLHFKIMKREEIHGEVVRLLKETGLQEEFCGRLPGELSGGELQRAVIARAISVHPEVVILDEATSALDVSVQYQILELLGKLRGAKGMAYILITHDLSVVHRMADRVGILYRGWLVELMDRNQLQEEELHPYTRELLEHMLVIGKRTVFQKERILENTEHEKDGCPFFARCRERERECAKWKPRLIPVSGNHWMMCRKKEADKNR